jgi:beta-lactamase superfamily II metal-dependent hydrolase
MVCMPTRREFLRNGAAAAAVLQGSHRSLLFSSSLFAAGEETLAPWKPGMLDIHHISTGRGNSALMIMPDGTTMLVDAGALNRNTSFVIDPKPDGSRRPGEWIGRYVDRQLKAAGLDGIDTFMNTHLHDDHLGEFDPSCPEAPGGGYKLTGITDVAAIVPIRRFVDRAWPDYSYPSPDVFPFSAPFVKNYRSFLAAQVKAGKTVERFKPGSNTQFALKKPGSYPNFEVRNLIGNGEVWTGQGSSTKKLFPDVAGMKPAELPSENCCSCAIRVKYGKFGYYTGGDLPSGTNYGKDPWRDVETPAAEACGPVSVAVFNHHGYYDAEGPGYVRALRPRVFVIMAWDSAHPTVNTLAAVYSKELYPGERDVFSTALKPELKITNKRTADFKSSNGHVVVRVEEGGERFRVAVVTNADESGRVVGSFGPYVSAG